LSFCCRRIEERDREEARSLGALRLLVCDFAGRKCLHLWGCLFSVNKIQELLFFKIASVWKYRTGDVCCVIVVLLCLSVFESLRIREIRKAWKGHGDVEVPVGVRSIWRT
jgi:hypothetical protein